MFDKLHHIIKRVEKEGADFVEARYDELKIQTIIKENHRIQECKAMRQGGVGFNIFYKGATGYAFSPNLNSEHLEKSAFSAFNIAKASAEMVKSKSIVNIEQDSEKIHLKPKLKEPAWEVELDKKMKLMKRMEQSAQENGKNISSLKVFYGELSGEKMFTNSEEKEIHWHPYILDMRCLVTSKDQQGNLLTGAQSKGGSVGLEYFNKKGNTPENIGKDAAIWAKEKLKAKAAPAGEYPALCENLLTGVLAHESFGHMTEGDFITSKASPLYNKIGEKLGTEKVSIIDEGILSHNGDLNGMYLPYDDQGIETKKVVLMENGILKNFLHTRTTAQMLDAKSTGNARAVNFAYPPIPRMKNTYFMPGDLTEEEALEELGTGIYAIQSAGGQVELDGSFVFLASRGYWIENGEKKYPLKDVTLSGNILDLLNNVKGATKDLKIFSGYFGGCGKDGQFPLPVGLGGPKLLVDSVQFGGEA
jgi:TldD protein